MIDAINGQFSGNFVLQQAALQRAAERPLDPTDQLAAYLVSLVLDLSDKGRGGRANARRVAARLRLDIDLLIAIQERLEKDAYRGQGVH